MPVHGLPNTGTETINYKQKYKTLKKKLKLLVYEQECFLEELRKSQRKLLRVSRDRSFLLDRLMQYEKVEESSGDSDATASSDSDTEKTKDGNLPKKKKASQGLLSLYNNTGLLGPLATSNLTSLAATAANMPAGSGSSGPSTSLEPPKKKQKVTKKVTKPPTSTPPSTASATVPAVIKQSPSSVAKPQSRSLSREEVERQLELKQSKRPQFMSLEKTPHSLPDDIFSNENSNPDGSTHMVSITKDAHGLVIDLPE